MVHHFHIALFCISAAVLLLNAFSSRLRRWAVTEPFFAALLGVLAGPFCLGLIDLRGDVLLFLREFCRLTLAIGLMGIALRIPPGHWKKNASFIIPVILFGMPLMWLFASGLLLAGWGVSVLTAFMIGAAITPTDPVVSVPIVTGRFAKSHIDERIRRNISAEAGANDGLGFLIVNVPLLVFLSPGAGEAARQVLIQTLLKETAGGFAFGALTGFAAGKLFEWTESREYSEKNAALGFSVALTISVMAAAKLLGINDILAVFAAGIFFSHVLGSREHHEEEQTQEIINRFFLIPVFVVFGAALPVSSWAQYGWAAAWAPFIVVLRRLPVILALRVFFKKIHPWDHTAFIGWFGPIGVSAIFYAAYLSGKTGDTAVWHVSSLLIFSSIVIHSLSSVPLARWLMRRRPVMRSAAAGTDPVYMEEKSIEKQSLPR